MPFCFFIATIANNNTITSSGVRAEAASEVEVKEATDSERQQEPFFFSPYKAISSIPGATQEVGEIPKCLLRERSFLTDHGINFFLTYTSDIAGNPVGGTNPNGFTYADFFYLGCILNSQELLGFPGGSLNMSVSQVDGNNLSQKNIGSQFPVQEIFVGQTFYWYQFFYEQHFWNNCAALKIGRISTGNDFATSPLYWFYMNGGIDGAPQALLVNEGISYYATSTWGSMIKVHLSRSTVARIGVYQVTQGSINGMNWDFYPNDGVLLAGQYSWNPIFSSTSTTNKTESSEDESSPSALAAQNSKNPIAVTSTKNFQGHYWMGGYYSTSTYNEALSTSQQPNSFGLYWHMDQTVYKPDPETNSGLILWSVLTLSPQQSIASMPFQANAGAVYTGLIPGRRNDATLFGVAYGSFSPNYATTQQQNGGGYPTYELMYELGYRINLTPATYIQPDLQWILNPGGTGTIPNALVVGAQMGVSF